MQPEELKTRWETLSRQLERQQIISRALLNDTVGQRRRNIAAYSWANIATGIIALPLVVILARSNEMPANTLIVGLAGLIIALLLEVRKLRLLHRTHNLKADLTTQERNFTALLRAQRDASVFAFVFIAGYVGWLLVAWHDLLIRLGRFELAAILLFGALLTTYLLYKWEAGRFRLLRKITKELREFNAK